MVLGPQRFGQPLILVPLKNRWKGQRGREGKARPIGQGQKSRWCKGAWTCLSATHFLREEVGLGIIIDHPNITDHPKAPQNLGNLGMCLVDDSKIPQAPKNHEWTALFMPWLAKYGSKIAFTHLQIFTSKSAYKKSKHLLLGGTFWWVLFCRFRWSVIPFLRTTHRGLDSGPRGPETQVTVKKKWKIYRNLKLLMKSTRLGLSGTNFEFHC